MMAKNKYLTEQEKFWAGSFGDEYTKRNTRNKLVSKNLVFFSNILQLTHNISSILEFGANNGSNLIALNKLLPSATLSAVEINLQAAEALQNITLQPPAKKITTFHQSILDFKPQEQYDLILIKTVLIHINPDNLRNVYKKIYESSKKYIIIAEYYNPTPVQVIYRGHNEKTIQT